MVHSAVGLEPHSTKNLDIHRRRPILVASAQEVASSASHMDYDAPFLFPGHLPDFYHDDDRVAAQGRPNPTWVACSLATSLVALLLYAAGWNKEAVNDSGLSRDTALNATGGDSNDVADAESVDSSERCPSPAQATMWNIRYLHNVS